MLAQVSKEYKHRGCPSPKCGNIFIAITEADWNVLEARSHFWTNQQLFGSSAEPKMLTWRSNPLYYFKSNTQLPPQKCNGYPKQKHQKGNKWRNLASSPCSRSGEDQNHILVEAWSVTCNRNEKRRHMERCFFNNILHFSVTWSSLPMAK